MESSKFPTRPRAFSLRMFTAPSEVIDPRRFCLVDRTGKAGPGKKLCSTSFTSERSLPPELFSGVEERLDYLVDLGVTAIELMPVSDFPGRRNWGYDGVLPFAPDSSYGRPEDLKALIDAAHGKGLMVLLDVVYNHFGPEGNYLQRLRAAIFYRPAQDAMGRRH